VGGTAGALLVTRLDPAYFAALVPWLILTAALLFMFQPVAGRLTRCGRPAGPPPKRAVAGIVIFQFFVAVYGGYFGAGIGILMLSALALMGMADIHRMNALKIFLAFCMNGISAVVFIAEDTVAWPYALAMMAAAIAGGYFGARLGLRLKPDVVRWIVVLVGFGLAAYFFVGG
jgi:uncharacterized membrane protein YfcA